MNWAEEDWYVPSVVEVNGSRRNWTMSLGEREYNSNNETAKSNIKLELLLASE